MADNSELFRNIVESIFNTWTALRLAVEHGMGGHRGKEIVLRLVDEVTNLVCKGDIGAEEIADFLIEFMDTEFHTECEDNSPDEVATVLWQFYQHCKAGNHNEINLELSKLPKCEVWLCKPLRPMNTQEEAMDSEDAVSSGQSSNIAVGELDPEWTQVKSKRRKERL
ncbi:Pre-rRNA-processing protein TSR2-like protein [Zootermopsis nevadensis]|uniref:Pre-rRNA-processing protein TSR2 homolog n=1 Tax=Zootermopsis nevadensis TaxID=136037 RepID=A0A067RHG1_ZOONE|nr:Pre-rRNA-processing protein TSR2-like protein [Zootermopsis nevadensis]